MSELRCCCLLLLVKILTGTGVTSKFVCPGESVQLFKMTNFHSCNAVVYLFLHGDRITELAKWTLMNCTLNSSFLPEYKDKVYFNTNGTIVIHDVSPWDEGRYIMRKEDTLRTTYVEQIYVMELPTTECRPTILQLGNSLSVSLKHDVCGKPVATPYWRDCCGVSYSNESVLKFSPGKEACTCNACIVSPALKCARNSTSLDYCSTFIKGGTNTTPVSMETMDVKMVVILAVGITLVISFFMVLIMITILMHRKRRIARRQSNTRGPEPDSDVDDQTKLQRYKESKKSDAKVRQRYKESKQPAEMQDLLWIRETQPSAVAESDGPKQRQIYKELMQSDPKIRQRYKESKQSAEMQDLLWIRETQPSAVAKSDAETQDLFPIPNTQPSTVIASNAETQDLFPIPNTQPSTVIASDAETQDLFPIPNTQPSTVIASDAETQDLFPIPNTQPSTVIASDDPKPMTEKASSTMRGLSHNSKLIRVKGPEAGHCTFCGQENNVMFILPCDHLGSWYMPTCIKCGICYKPCEKCKPSNAKYMEFAQWTVLADENK